MLLEAIDIVVRRHPALPPALSGVSLRVRPGQVTAIVGSNGSGKSTLARALVGLVPLERGRITAGDQRIGAPRVGLVVQDPAAQLVCATVADELALAGEQARLAPDAVRDRVATLLARHELAELQARDPQYLSGGQQQRVAVAAIDAAAVDVLVLDEPTALLDQPARVRFRRRMREEASRGRGIIWITQEAEDVAACDDVIVLDAGHVVWSGTVQEYVSSADLPATWGLELPAAARMAHALIAAGVMVPATTIPVRLDALVDLLAGVA